MTIEWDPETQKRLELEVQSGRYGSASEVVREALRLLEQRDEAIALRKAEIRQKIDEGWAAARRGEFADSDALFEQMEDELDRLERPAPK